MIVLNVRNVHDALPRALQLLDEEGIPRESRNGPVLQAPWPVATVYQKPLEKVVFWPERDANPFLHLYESLWMLDGRRILAPLLRYTKQYAQYSDDGVYVPDAYGYRWRRHFGPGLDQLDSIIETLQKNPDCRRQVLQMWDPKFDSRNPGKAVPCNLTATLQRGSAGELNLVVFCRSNDAVWGTYGANGVTFATLLEYVASEIGCEVGTYTQVSVNFHAYLNDQYERLRKIPRPSPLRYSKNPYEGEVVSIPMRGITREQIKALLYDADSGWALSRLESRHPWCRMANRVLQAHYSYKNYSVDTALEVLNFGAENVDWVIAAREWIERRQKKMKEGQE